jgi:hypothetical protein
MAQEAVCGRCGRMILNARTNQKFCRGGHCRNAAWVSDHPRRRRARRRPLTRLTADERRAAVELAGFFI